jgi:methylated-DNA-[protein]-cysteine S-methyltransferase
MHLYYKEMKSPVGKLKLITNTDALVAVLWKRERGDRIKLDTPKLDPEQATLIAAERQLAEYFSGTRTEFDLPLEPGGTKFQKKVWQALRKIPYGQTRSYLSLAKVIGAAEAVRAVGHANSKNPLAIVVPCHRVIGADGSLTGFAGGLETKAALLAFEAKTRAAMNSW